MIFSLLAIFGIGTAFADDKVIYQINGTCENSYSKSIDGVFDISCNKMKFIKIDNKVIVSIKDNSNMEIDLSIDNKNKNYSLNRNSGYKERIDTNVFNKCIISKEYITCDSYNNQEVILHIEFKRK